MVSTVLGMTDLTYEMEKPMPCVVFEPTKSHWVAGAAQGDKAAHSRRSRGMQEERALSTPELARILRIEMRHHFYAVHAAHSATRPRTANAASNSAA